MTQRRTSLIAFTVLASLITAGCSSANEPEAAEPEIQTVIVADAAPTLVLVESRGESTYQEDRDVARGSVEVPYQPQAVVTFDIGTLDTLDAIGAGDSVVGIPNATLPDYLSSYSSLPTVGSLFEPDFEAVAALDPDLIVTAGRSTAQYDELAEIATTIDLSGGLAGAFDPQAGLARADQLGEIFGEQDAVAERREAIEEMVAEISSGADGTALMLSVSGGNYGAFGEGSRFGYFFDVLGFEPAVIAAELPGVEGSPHGDTVSNEFILTANPDWIIAFDRGAATGDSSTIEQTLDNELVARTAAAQDGRIIYLPSNELYIVINGLTAIENVLDVVHDAVDAA